MSKELDKFVTLIRRRWLIALSVCVIGLALLPVIAPLIPAHKGVAELLIVSDALKDTTTSDPNLPAIITSTEVLDRVIRRLRLDTDSIALAKKIKTKLPAKASILELTYKDTDAVRAASVANAIADESSAYYHELALSGYTNVLNELNSRIAESHAKVASTDRQLQRASAKNAFASSDKALDDLASQMDALQAQRGQVSASLAADQASASAFQKQLTDIYPIVRGEILQKDVVYQQLQTELAKDVADLTSERASFTDSFPGLVALERRVIRERAQMKAAEASALQNGAGLSPSFTQTTIDGEHAAGLVAADQNRLNAINLQVAAAQMHLQQVAGPGAAVGTLRAERDAAVQQYMTLTQRLSVAQGDAAQAASLGTVVVVSRAIPGKSSLLTWLLGIGVLILAVAIGAAYLADMLDPHFWGVREIENVYGRNVLLEVGGRR